ncbi:hypothetical protein E2C01_015716 [Portunus trituberculatus]|uniref:Uncharacterized protein n=1 Tax=Portunus trituberculatus TaxID=210409 RepID=A0A5B7DND0_PORTR|nr:hypothetical protein [Portunus trituberculatus]
MRKSSSYKVTSAASLGPQHHHHTTTTLFHHTTPRSTQKGITLRHNAYSVIKSLVVSHLGALKED